MNKFDDAGYTVLRGVLNEQTLKLLKCTFLLVKDVEQFYSSLSPQAVIQAVISGDGHVNNSFTHYGAFCFEGLFGILQPLLQETVGKELFPCYSCARIMYTGAAMPIHKDRVTCEYSTSICISEDPEHPYPLFLKDRNGDTQEIALSPGDMLVYKGAELEHWRDKYEGAEHIQAFLHYVDAAGPYSHRKYDTRPMLGLPGESRTLFDT
jgi:hypothetical protein